MTSGVLLIAGRIINAIIFIDVIRECRLLCDFYGEKVCYSEIKQEVRKVRSMTL